MCASFPSGFEGGIQVLNVLIPDRAFLFTTSNDRHVLHNNFDKPKQYPGIEQHAGPMVIKIFHAQLR